MFGWFKRKEKDFDQWLVLRGDIDSVQWSDSMVYICISKEILNIMGISKYCLLLMVKKAL